MREKYQLTINAETIDEFKRLVSKVNTSINQRHSRIYISKTSIAASDKIIVQEARQ